MKPETNTKTRNRTKTLLSVFLLTATVAASAQVTIGTDTSPVSGALLQLKEKDEQGRNSIRGIGMPRVVLTDLKKLQPMYSYADEANKPSSTDLQAHTGLIVYHVSGAPKKECAAIPDGLYVWDGQQWNAILDKKPGGLNLSTDTLTFYNADPQLLDVSWGPSGASVVPPTYSIPSGFSFSPASGAWTGLTSPQTVSITPTAFPTTPFTVSTATATFSFGECGQTTQFTLKQVNKALTLSTKQHVMAKGTATGTRPITNTLKSNAIWRLASTMPNDATSAFSNVKLNNTALSVDGESKGKELSDGTANGATNNLTYNITVGADRSRYSTFVFEDVENPKRFKDVILRITICDINVTKMSQWAAIAGFEGVSENKISDGDDTAKGIDTPNAITGIAWHRDQNGNIFLSSSFAPGNTTADITGNSERWMITNLAATKYDFDGPDFKDFYTGGDSQAQSTGELTGSNYNSGNPTNTAYWGYPNGSSNKYNNDPRIGFLYTWDAATAGKGGSDGKGNVDNTSGGTATNNESGFAPGSGNNQEVRRQGICPKGWHLPSDYEWTELERNIIRNKGNFSTTATSSDLDYELSLVPYPTPGSGKPIPDWQGLTTDGHGKAMKEECEKGTNTSNPISTLERPGFNWQIVGYATNGNASYFDTYGYFWAASSFNNNAWGRYCDKGQATVNREYGYRYQMFSVRCKKDN